MDNKKAREPKVQSTQKAGVDAAAVKSLAEILNETSLTEIEYETNACRIRVVRGGGEAGSYGFMPHPVAHPLPQASFAPVSTGHHHPSTTTVEHASPALENHPGAVKAPMVGTVYLSPQPNAPHFIKEGDKVAEGATLMIIEAMKVMNPIRSPKGGTVKKLLVHDAEPVEYDHPLVIIE